MLRALSHMEQGHVDTILKIRGTLELHRQLLQTGLAVGIVIERGIRASVGDSVEINLSNSRISLDKQLADCIYVEPG